MNRDFTYIDDVVEAIVRLDRPPQGNAAWSSDKSQSAPDPPGLDSVGLSMARSRWFPLINQTNLHACGRRKTAARVLENRRARKGTVSSNLTPSPVTSIS